MADTNKVDVFIIPPVFGDCSLDELEAFEMPYSDQFFIFALSGPGAREGLAESVLEKNGAKIKGVAFTVAVTALHKRVTYIAYFSTNIDRVKGAGAARGYQISNDQWPQHFRALVSAGAINYIDKWLVDAEKEVRFLFEDLEESDEKTGKELPAS
jgi:hypothetical protein